MRKTNYFAGRIPVSCHLFNKRAVRLESSNELKQKFDNYFNLVDSIVEKENKDEEFLNKKEQLSRDYGLIKELVVSEIRLSGDKKSVYTDQLLEFLFICMYKLIDGLGMSQKDAGAIFNLKPNDFGKIGIFPERCQRSFNKETNLFLPIEPEQDTIKAICEFINKKVLTNYACRGVIAIANTPSIFVNLATGDTKKFIMAIPEPEIDENDIIVNCDEFNYAFARSLFYDGNRLQDKNGKKITFGQVKDKISELIQLKDIEISVPLAEYLLQSDMDMSQLVRDGQIDIFNQKRKLLQETYEDIDIYQARFDAIETSYIGTEDYYENGYDMEEHDRREAEGLPLVTEDYETYSKRILSEAVNKKETLLCDMMMNLNMDKMITENNADILNYVIDNISKQLTERILLEDMKEEYILSAAASYFIVEYFKNGVSLSDYQRLTEYLKTSKITDFIDSIGISGVSALETRNSLLKRLKEVDENSKGKGRTGIKCLKESIEASKDIRTDDPVLLYIDADAYLLTQEEVNEILDKYDVCLVIRSGQSYEGLSPYSISENVTLYSNYEED